MSELIENEILKIQQSIERIRGFLKNEQEAYSIKKKIENLTMRLLLYINFD